MARILVKRAATLTRDREQLCQGLAEHHLRTDEERKRFLSGVSAGAYTGRSPRAAPDDTGSTTRDEIAAATLDRTTKILMRYMGPIAAVLVKKTASAARNETDLYTRLGERITEVKERERFLAEVRRPF